LGLPFLATDAEYECPPPVEAIVTDVDDNRLAPQDARGAQLLATWQQLDERYQEVVIATANALAAFVRFRRIDAETRRIAMRLLDDPSETDFRALHQHPAGGALSEWLLSLPGYLNDVEDTERPSNGDTGPDSSDHAASSDGGTSTDLRGDVSRLFHRSTQSS
jgi:hypothetical protein